MSNTLALCMLVKNEQQYLPYCLASVYKYCDEIIIVDTGSTDKTIEIAEGFGAYVIRAPWKNDFALIRNIAHSAAESDWILWLDGDEALSTKGIEMIKNRLLNDRDAYFFLLPRVNFWKDLKHMFCYPDSQYKIYRNHVGLRWEHAIHEKIYDEQDSEHKKRLRFVDIPIYHYAYVKSPEEVKKKMELYIQIENPDMDPRKIANCSTEHSFFYDKLPEGVQDYNGPLPEIFNQLVVSQEEIMWKDGPSVMKFKKRIETSEYKYEDVTEVKKQSLVQPNDKYEIVKDLCSIIIVTHNKIEYVQPLVQGIFDSTHVPFEIIVVDNGSTEQNVMDYLIPMSKEHENFRYMNLNENQGFAKGYNAGVKMAKGEWIVVQNNDTLVTDYWLTKMINHLKENPEYALVAPVSNNIHGEHQMIAAPEGSSFGDYIKIVEQNIKEEGKQLLESSWVTGCVMCFHRNLLSDLAKIDKEPKVEGILFSECYPWGMSEDTELNWHITHRLQKKVGVARDCLVWHHGSKTLGELDKDWNQIQEQNNKILRGRWPEIFPDG